MSRYTVRVSRAALILSGSGFRAANGDTAEGAGYCSWSSRGLLWKRRGMSGRERCYYVSFRGENPSARTFVDILGAAPVNAFELRVPGHPSRPFFFSLPPFRRQIHVPPKRAGGGSRDTEEEKGAQNTHVFFSSSGATEPLRGFILTFSPPRHSPLPPLSSRRTLFPPPSI